MPKDVTCKNCNNYRRDWCEKVVDSPNPSMPRTCQYFRVRTNADRIRAMSDEELAEFLYSCEFCHICEEGCDNCRYNGECERRLADWLKLPAEE